MASQVALPAVVVDLGGLQLERHVRQAFQDAWKRSGGRPLSAAHLLQGAVSVGGSEAFATLARLLPWRRAPAARTADVPPLDLHAVAFERPLAESFAVAESFLVANNRAVWGRDYVTLALLAKDDASLEDLTGQAGTTLGDVRQAWLEFLRSSKRHRSIDEWEHWWRSAGAIPADAADTATNAYLLTWNPAHYDEFRLARHLERRAPDGSVTFGWSSGNNRSMKVGDRVYLLRQGERSRRGLVGVGTVSAAPQEQPHWDEQRRAEGKTSLIVQVRWQALDVTPIVELSSLIALTGERKQWATQVGGVQVAPEVRERLEAAWPAAWERHRHGLAPLAAPELEPRRHIARFDPDVGPAPDSLNIDRYVDAFARIAASRTLAPPLSVGLFGDWGSGKTFFMDRLHDKIATLANGEGPGSEEMYLRNICQIRFNAWHYAETDLWASLVSTVFKELRRYLDGPADDADEFNKLLNRLEIAAELRGEAQLRLGRAEQRLREAQLATEQAERTLEELPAVDPPSGGELRTLMSAAVTEVWAATPEELSDLLREAHEFTGDDRFYDAQKALVEGRTSVADIKTLLDETQALVSRAGFWWRLLTTAEVHRTARFWAVLGVVLAIPVVFVVLQSYVDVGIGWAAVVLEALTVGGAAVTWARSTLARATPVFNRLDALQATIDRSVEDAQDADRREHERRKAEAAQREQEARRALAAEQAALEAAKKEVQAAKAALRESTSAARLGRFIRERASSVDYDKYLGLIAMIHRDFDQLSRLMRSGSAGEAANGDLPRVDRIVLYIDDLDRCYPPEKVVRVLEAVHLLLFFPLFVVFVGVDSRWVSRALNRYYDQMLSDESLQVDSALPQRAPADSQDFLEKIFQVPFWLRRMDPPAVQRLIHSLITADEVGPPAGTVEPGAMGDGQPPEDGAPPPDGNDEEELTPPDDGTAPGKGAAKRTTDQAERLGETIGEPLAPPTESLRISETELAFMDEVAPLMPRTPRSVKRFVNIYRLYKAALSTAGLGKFLGTVERPGNFRAVQILLALVIGAPEFARAVVTVLEEMDDPGSQRLSDLPELLGEPDHPTWQSTLQALQTFARGDNNLQLEALREVSPLVSRYSVHHMVSDLPGKSALD